MCVPDACAGPGASQIIFTFSGQNVFHNTSILVFRLYRQYSYIVAKYKCYLQAFQKQEAIACGEFFSRVLISQRAQMSCIFTGGKYTYIMLSCKVKMSKTTAKLSEKKAETSVVLCVFNCVFYHVRANADAVSYRRFT